MSTTEHSDETRLRDEIREMRGELGDVRQLIELVLHQLGMSREEVLHLRAVLHAQRGEPLFGIGVDSMATYRLRERGWTTFELVAMQGRATTAAEPGVGRASIRALDKALAERHIEWATPGAGS